MQKTKNAVLFDAFPNEINSFLLVNVQILEAMFLLNDNKSAFSLIFMSTCYERLCFNGTQWQQDENLRLKRLQTFL